MPLKPASPTLKSVWNKGTIHVQKRLLFKNFPFQFFLNFRTNLYWTKKNKTHINERELHYRGYCLSIVPLKLSKSDENLWANQWQSVSNISNSAQKQLSSRWDPLKIINFYDFDYICLNKIKFRRKYLCILGFL